MIHVFQLGNPQQCTMISDKLLREKGHYVQAINYPTVARGEEKLRFAPTPHHNEEMMDHLIEDMKDVWKDLKLPFTGMQCPKVYFKNIIHIFKIIVFFLS